MPSTTSPVSSFSLVARQVVRERGAHTVLDRVDVSIGPRTRLGVVGPNGVGKTTLLRVLAGLEPADGGAITKTPPDLRVGYLAQEPERRDEDVLAFLARRTGVAAAEAELERAAAALATGGDPAADEYASALDAYLGAGGPDLDARARAACDDVGLPDRLLDAPMRALSGGEVARASLAAILLSRFDVLLLDEPTNDLDFAGLERLERFVDDLPGGVLIVSHDRAFLERTVTRVLELDEHTRTGTEYGGGWAGYLEARATARRHAQEDYAAYRAERGRLEQRARVQRQWAVQGVRAARRDTSERDKFVRRFRVATSEQQAAKARATRDAIDRLEVVEKPWEGWDLRFRVASAPRSGDVVMRLRDAVVERDEFVLGPVDVEIGWRDRVAVVGPNGSGKTTLLLALLGRLPLVSGERSVGASVVVGEMDQGRAAFAVDRPLLDAFLTGSELTTAEARSLLAKFGLGAEHVGRNAATLSPGERTRAVLARFAAQGVNCLVLDEPTNHLDLEAIEQLEQALEGYDGTLLVVTHDRRLLEALHLTRTLAAWGQPVDQP